MVYGIFPRGLAACISEGRSPRPQELALLADKVWREVFVRSAGSRNDAAAIARAAFLGDADVC
jgi:hypothetical protein